MLSSSRIASATPKRPNHLASGRVCLLACMIVPRHLPLGPFHTSCIQAGNSPIPKDFSEVLHCTCAASNGTCVRTAGCVVRGWPHESLDISNGAYQDWTKIIESGFGLNAKFCCSKQTNASAGNGFQVPTQML